jgi:hypothetical protein
MRKSEPGQQLIDLSGTLFSIVAVVDSNSISAIAPSFENTDEMHERVLAGMSLPCELIGGLTRAGPRSRACRCLLDAANSGSADM